DAAGNGIRRAVLRPAIALHQVGDTKLTHAVSLNLDDLDADALGLEGVPLDRQPSEVLVDEPTERAEVIVFLETDPERVLDILDWKPTVREQDVGCRLLEQRFLAVVLILNLADDLVENVLDGDQPGSAAVLVGDNGDVNAASLQLGKEIVDLLRLRDHERWSNQVQQRN